MTESKFTVTDDKAQHRVSSRDGGCWFCHKACESQIPSEDVCFTCEWDAYFHMSCLKKELRSSWNPFDRYGFIEMDCIASEWGIPIPSFFVRLIRWLWCSKIDEIIDVITTELIQRVWGQRSSG